MADDYHIVRDELTVQLMDDGTFTVSREREGMGKNLPDLAPNEAAQVTLEDLANMLAKAGRG